MDVAGEVRVVARLDGDAKDVSGHGGATSSSPSVALLRLRRTTAPTGSPRRRRGPDCDLPRAHRGDRICGTCAWLCGSRAYRYLCSANSCEYVAASSIAPCAAQAPLIGYVVPDPAGTYVALAPTIEYVAPAPAVFRATPAPVAGHVGRPQRDTSSSARI